jgi:hypothetical protein
MDSPTFLVSPRLATLRDEQHGLTVTQDNGAALTLWGAAEIAVAIMAASVPMMRVLVVTFRRKRMSKEAWSNDTEKRMVETP